MVVIAHAALAQALRIEHGGNMFVPSLTLSRMLETTTVVVQVEFAACVRVANMLEELCRRCTFSDSAHIEFLALS